MKTLTKILLHDIRPYFPQLSFVLFLMLVVAGFEAILPWPFKYLIDNVLGDQPLDYHSFPDMLIPHFHNQETLGFFIVFVFFFISVFLSLSEYFKSSYVTTIMKGIILRFSESAFRSIESIDIGYFRQQQIGDFVYRLSYDVSALGDLIEQGIMPLLSSSLYLLFTTAILFTISVKLTLISLAVLPFLAVSLYVFNRRIVKASKRSERWNSTVFSFVDQALNQLKIIQSFVHEKQEASEFNNKMESSIKAEIHLFHLDFLLSLMVGVIIAITYSIIIAIGINYFYVGDLTTGLLIIFIFYLDNLTNPILDIIYAWADFKEARVKVYRMKDFYSSRKKLVDAGEIHQVVDPTIEFKHVSLKTNEGEKILDDVSFRVEKNTITVVVGVSGSGKTSMISLISRLIGDPTSGEVLIGGQDVKKYSIEALRKSISYVPQENVLFNDSIRNNIAFGKENATDEEIEEYAHLALADEFIKDHKNHYKFIVGEGGNYLSGGQRQRISIARSFIKKPQILILDEPLSSLDLQTRSQVWKNIYSFSKGRTTIIVSNILDVISSADLVIVMSRGRVVEMGRYADLKKKSKYFHFVVRVD